MLFVCLVFGVCVLVLWFEFVVSVYLFGGFDDCFAVWIFTLQCLVLLFMVCCRITCFGCYLVDYLFCFVLLLLLVYVA